MIRDLYTGLAVGTVVVVVFFAINGIFELMGLSTILGLLQ